MRHSHVPTNTIISLNLPSKISGTIFAIISKILMSSCKFLEASTKYILLKYIFTFSSHTEYVERERINYCNHKKSYKNFLLSMDANFLYLRATVK